MTGLTPLETAVLDAICVLYPSHRSLLAAQLAKARVTSREFTGVGFFTEFEVDPAAPAIRDLSSPLGTVESLVGPDAYPIQFIVFVSPTGFLTVLEGYSYFDGYGDLDLTVAAFTSPTEVVFNQA